MQEKQTRMTATIISEATKRIELNDLSFLRTNLNTNNITPFISSIADSYSQSIRLDPSKVRSIDQQQHESMTTPTSTIYSATAKSAASSKVDDDKSSQGFSVFVSDMLSQMVRTSDTLQYGSVRFGSVQFLRLLPSLLVPF